MLDSPQGWQHLRFLKARLQETLKLSTPFLSTGLDNPLNPKPLNPLNPPKTPKLQNRKNSKQQVQTPRPSNASEGSQLLQARAMPQFRGCGLGLPLGFSQITDG